MGWAAVEVVGTVTLVSCSPGAPGAQADDPDGQGASDRWKRTLGPDARRVG